MGVHRDAVAEAQRVLNSSGAALSVDGQWGPKTQAAYDRASSSTQAQVRETLALAGISIAAIRDFQKSSGDSTKQTFRNVVVPEVRRLAREKGLNGDLMVAQLTLESGGGARIPPGSNNWGGIKALPGQPTVKAMTSEFLNGKMVRVEQPFRKFDTPEDFAAYYVNKLATSKRYAPVYTEMDNKRAAAKLAASGYATDPNYRAKIESMLA